MRLQVDVEEIALARAVLDTDHVLVPREFLHECGAQLEVHVFRNVVQHYGDRTFVGDAEIVPPQRLVGHGRAEVVRRHDEDRVHAALRRALRVRQRRAR